MQGAIPGSPGRPYLSPFQPLNVIIIYNQKLYFDTFNFTHQKVTYKLMTGVVLQQQQRELLQEERRIAQELQACLVGFEEADTYSTTLRQVITALDELFLLVVVGEFNSGKSACINALLHASMLEEGVIPTTNQVTMLRFGDQDRKSLRNAGILELNYPADFLRDITVVDTPGVNAVLRQHEQLTEDFIPRSDLILFVTSVDRPFTESERAFMERIRT